MTIDQIKELYYITPISNISSILKLGILCHNKAVKLPHIDISMNDIQERRAKKKIPNGRNLHDYANLYFDAHNPMLSRRRNQNSKICILCISKEVLKLNDVIISDRNASSDYCRFYQSPGGLKYLDYDIIFGRYWKYEDPYKYYEHKSIKCAEVLVPDKIDPIFISKAYVINKKVKEKLIEQEFSLDIMIKKDIFF